MLETDIKELRKAVKATDTVIDWIYTLYVNSENKVLWEQTGKFGNMEEAELFRHQNLFAKSLSPSLGIRSFSRTLAVESPELLALRKASGRDPEEFAFIRDALLENYSHKEPYYVYIAKIAMDIKAKGSDRQALEDGSDVYEAVLFGLCPAKLETPSLGFDEDHVGELPRHWRIKAPVHSFLYPSLNERQEDRYEVMMQGDEPENDPLFDLLFEPLPLPHPTGQKEQKERFSDLLTRLDAPVDAVAAATEAIMDKRCDKERAVYQLEKEDVADIVRNCGIEADDADFDEAYEAAIGDAELTLGAPSDSYINIKTDAGSIKIPADKAELLKTRTIDGRDYLLIPADGLILVNGVSAVFRSDDQDNDM